MSDRGKPAHGTLQSNYVVVPTHVRMRQFVSSMVAHILDYIYIYICKYVCKQQFVTAWFQSEVEAANSMQGNAYYHYRQVTK